jgi:hypothetical protein
MRFDGRWLVADELPPNPSIKTAKRRLIVRSDNW